MGGTIDLSAEQLATIAAEAARDRDEGRYFVRAVISPELNRAVRVQTFAISFGSLVTGHFYVLRNGERLTGSEYRENTSNLPEWMQN